MLKIILLILLISSCGRKEDSKSKRQLEEFDEDGIFYGRVESLNRSRTGGTIKIVKAGDSLQVTVKLKGSALTTLEQFLYESSTCPTADLDGNGNIDLGEVNSQSGAKIVAFSQGIEETSYHLLLSDVGRKVMKFADRTVLVFDNYNPVGCATLSRVLDEPEETETSEPRPPRRRPTRPAPEPEVEPPAPSPEPDSTSWWDRLTDRLREWWCRVRRRCG